MTQLPKLLLATENQGKARELLQLLQGIPYEVLTPQQVGITLDVPENGTTFEENAQKKAMAYAGKSRLLTLADDSGLEVEALNGDPGVKSRRYAGDKASDEERINYLLAKLKNITWEKRTARFRCLMAIASFERILGLCEGECRGIIAFEPKGTGGFGYDPVFYLPELGKTMAELPPELKNKISHRAKAAQKARAILEKLKKDAYQ